MRLVDIATRYVHLARPAQPFQLIQPTITTVIYREEDPEEFVNVIVQQADNDLQENPTAMYSIISVNGIWHVNARPHIPLMEIMQLAQEPIQSIANQSALSRLIHTYVDMGWTIARITEMFNADKNRFMSSIAGDRVCKVEHARIIPSLHGNPLLTYKLAAID